MPTLRRDLPPLNSLCAFEAAARHCSFTAAANELCLTQGAISRQIRGLETALDTPLFLRSHRGVALTGEGERLYHAVAEGLESIAAVVRELRRRDQPPTLTVSASVAFATYWLMPRLHGFKRLHPEIDLRVVASDKELAPASAGAELAICYGDGHWAEYRIEALFDEVICPVCSAAYLAEHGEIHEAADLLDAVLLHMEESGGIWRWIDWHGWLDSQGIEGKAQRSGLRLNTYPMVLQAALAGQGVALGWSYIVDDLVAQGSLLKPLEASLQTERRYFLASAHALPEDSPAQAFRRWLLDEVAH